MFSTANFGIPSSYPTAVLLVEYMFVFIRCSLQQIMWKTWQRCIMSREKPLRKMPFSGNWTFSFLENHQRFLFLCINCRQGERCLSVTPDFQVLCTYSSLVRSQIPSWVFHTTFPLCSEILLIFFRHLEILPWVVGLCFQLGWFVRSFVWFVRSSRSCLVSWVINVAIKSFFFFFPCLWGFSIFVRC